WGAFLCAVRKSGLHSTSQMLRVAQSIVFAKEDKIWRRCTHQRDSDFKALPHHPRWRPWHAFLAVEPQAACQAIARAGWQADHDSADAFAAAAAGIAQKLLGHY